MRPRRRQPGQHPPQSQRVLTQRWSHPVVTSGCRVALVEDQVDNFEYGRQTSSKLGTPRDFEGHSLFGESALGADDALGDGRFRDEEGTCDLIGGETSEQAESERYARLGRENGMTGGEDEAEEVVADVIVDCCVEIWHGHFLGDKLAAELLVLALEPRVAAEVIDGTMLGSGHEPGARVVRDA